jgi:putative acetyltransferase
MASRVFRTASVYQQGLAAMAIQVQQVTAPTADVRSLIGELDAELNAAYEPHQRHGIDLARIFRPGVMFFVARLDDQPVGCGGIAFDDAYPGIAEVKRMYVRPAARRRGVAAAIVRRLEAEARSRGVPRVVLETGDAQQAALRFYERAGFRRCAAFGAYALMPGHAIVRSVFFEKWPALSPANEV